MPKTNTSILKKAPGIGAFRGAILEFIAFPTAEGAPWYQLSSKDLERMNTAF